MSLLKSLLLVECAHFVAGETAADMLNRLATNYENNKFVQNTPEATGSKKTLTTLELLEKTLIESDFLYGDSAATAENRTPMQALHAYTKLVVEDMKENLLEEMIEMMKEKERKAKESEVAYTGFNTAVKSVLQANVAIGSSKLAAATSGFGPVVMVTCLGGYIVYREVKNNTFMSKVSNIGEQIHQTIHKTKISDLLTGDTAKKLGIDILSWTVEKQSEGMITTLAGSK